MELLIFLVIVGGLYVLVMRGGPEVPSDGLRMHLVPVASTLGLEPQLTMGGRTWRADGRVETENGEMHVVVEHDTLLREIRVHMDYPALRDRPMVLRRITSPTGDAAAPAEGWGLIYGRVNTGDPDFDRWFVVEGGALRVLAALDAPTRRLALEASALAEMEISGGALDWTRPASEELASEWIRDELPRLKALLEGLAQPPERWAERVMHAGEAEPSAPARLIRLGLLRLGEPVPDTLRERARERARGDADPRVRALGHIDDPETLTLIVQSAAAHPKGRAAALEALVRKLEPGDSLHFVSDALDSPVLVVKLAAIAAVQRPELSDLLPRLLAMVDDADAGTVIPLIETLEVLGGPEVDAALLRLVEGKAHDVAVRACQALGVVGSPECVAALTAIIEAQQDRSLVPVLRRVVGQIQERFGLQTGQLSVVDSPGALSEAGVGEGGGLSVAPDESGPPPRDAT